MASKVNSFSFLFALSCWAIFLLSAFNQSFSEFLTNLFTINRLAIVLVLTVVSLILNTISFGGMNNWMSGIRSMVTVILNMSLLAVLVFVITVGHLLG